MTECQSIAIDLPKILCYNRITLKHHSSQFIATPKNIEAVTKAVVGPWQRSSMHSARPLSRCGGPRLSVSARAVRLEHGQDLAGSGRKPQFGADRSVVYWMQVPTRGHPVSSCHGQPDGMATVWVHASQCVRSALWVWAVADIETRLEA
jgi:hypothetical protein